MWSPKPYPCEVFVLYHHLFVLYFESNYADLTNLTCFITWCQKIVFLNIITDLIRNIFKYWEAVMFMMLDTSFPKVNIHSKAQILSLPINTLFSLKWQVHLVHFQEVCQIPKYEWLKWSSTVRGFPGDRLPPTSCRLRLVWPSPSPCL